MSFGYIYETWRSMKIFLQAGGMFSANELHAYIGVLAYAGFLWVFRQTKFPAVAALLSVILLQSLNECIDILSGVYWHALPDLRLTVLDFVWTLTLPAILTIGFYVVYKTGVVKSVQPA